MWEHLTDTTILYLNYTCFLTNRKYNLVASGFLAPPTRYTSLSIHRTYVTKNTYEKRDPRSLTEVNVAGNGIIGYLRTCERKISTRCFEFFYSVTNNTIVLPEFLIQIGIGRLGSLSEMNRRDESRRCELWHEPITSGLHAWRKLLIHAKLNSD